MQEEYGIKLKLLTDGLKNSIAQVKNMMHGFKNEVKEDTEVKFKIDDTLTLKQLEKFKSDIETKLSELRESAEIGRQMRIIDPKEESNIRKLETGLKMVDDRIAEMGKEAENTKQKMAGISINTNMTSNTIIKGFDKGWRAVKKFAFSLLTVRGAYGLVRKAALSYLSQDKQLSNQLQKTWASVGALLAPIIETIVKWIRIGAAYLNYFIKALTGKDLIGKAVKKINKYNKSLAGTAKAAKSVNKELTTMDEVTNLSFDNTKDIDDAAEAFDDFKDIKLDPKVTEILDKWVEALKKLWDKLKPVRDALKGIVKWAIDHPDVVLTILGGAALLTTLGKLVGVGGAVGLLPGLAGALSTLAGIGIVTVGVFIVGSSIKEISDAVNALNGDLTNNSKQQKSLLDQSDTFISQIYDLGDAYGWESQQVKSSAKLLLSMYGSTKKQSGIIAEQLIGVHKGTKAYEELHKQLDYTLKKEKNQSKALYDLWKKGVLTKEQTDKYVETLSNQKKKYEDLAKEYSWNKELAKKFQDQADSLDKKLQNITKQDYACEIDIDTSKAETKEKNVKDSLTKFSKSIFTSKIEVETKDGEKKTTTLKGMIDKIAKPFKTTLEVGAKTKDAKDKISNFLTKVNNAFKAFGNNGIGSVISTTLKTLLNQIPSYDVGVNYVPNDQLAMVHKGEMIVPAKYNPATSGIGTGNAETNALLYELNRNILELSNKPTVLRVNGKDLAQATYGDFKDEGNRLNASKTITIN